MTACLYGNKHFHYFQVMKKERKSSLYNMLEYWEIEAPVSNLRAFCTIPRATLSNKYHIIPVRQHTLSWHRMSSAGRHPDPLSSHDTWGRTYRTRVCVNKRMDGWGSCWLLPQVLATDHFLSRFLQVSAACLCQEGQRTSAAVARYTGLNSAEYFPTDKYRHSW